MKTKRGIVPLNYTLLVADSVVMGASSAGNNFVDGVKNLHVLIEDIESSVDGQTINVHAIRAHVRCVSQYYFGLQPIVVQTDGTITDTEDISANQHEYILGQVISDYFGYRCLMPYKMSKKVPDISTSGIPGNTALEFTVEIPRFLINQIINKEVESERLQNLNFLLLGKSTANSQTITTKVIFEVEFSLVRKDIIIR
jgi:hypothetical protein